MDVFWGIVAIVGSVAAIGVLLYLQARGGTDRVEEDDARAYFDEHQRWPDERPGDPPRTGHQVAPLGTRDVLVEDAPPQPPWWRRLLVRLKLAKPA